MYHLVGTREAPGKLAVDRWGYICYPEIHVEVIAPDSGELVLQWGLPGEEDGDFGSISGIAVNQEDLIYVLDSRNHRVQYYNPMLTD